MKLVKKIHTIKINPKKISDKEAEEAFINYSCRGWVKTLIEKVY